MPHTKTLSAVFSFPGFRARSQLQGIFGDPHAGSWSWPGEKNGGVRRLRDPIPNVLRPRGGCGIPMRTAGASTWPLNNSASRVPAVAG